MISASRWASVEISTLADGDLATSVSRDVRTAGFGAGEGVVAVEVVVPFDLASSRAICAGVLRLGALAGDAVTGGLCIGVLGAVCAARGGIEGGAAGGNGAGEGVATTLAGV